MSFSQLEIPTPEKLPGLFIVFEGGDGAGKTTQIEKLANLAEGIEFDDVDQFKNKIKIYYYTSKEKR